MEQRLDILEEARIYWEKLQEFRDRRKRCRNYYRGIGNEKIIDPDTGELVSEDDYISEQGRIPLKINRIRPIILNLKGQFREAKTQRIAFPRNKDDEEAGDMMTEALNYVSNINQITEIDANAFEEALLSGLYGWKIGYKWFKELNHPDVTVDLINPNRIFFNKDITDKRLNGLRVIGEIHDLDIENLISLFAETEEQAEEIRRLYNYQRAQIPYDFPTGFQAADLLSFFHTDNTNLVRLIEIWRQEYKWRKYARDRLMGTYELTDLTQEEIDFINKSRVEEALAVGYEPPPPIELVKVYEPVWYYYFLTPQGHVLKSGETPYWHEEHPYVIGFASFVDGEIWGLVEDIIDPQRLINRILTNIDFMFGASAKGVLLVPEDAIPAGTTLEEFASEWTKFNGVIKFKAKPGAPIPQQIVQNSIPSGMFDFFGQMQQELKEISGVQSAMMGSKPDYSHMPASLYQQQILQSSITNKDYFDSFFNVRKKRDLMICKLIAQYYDDIIYLAVSGSRPDGRKYIVYNPASTRDIQYDIIVNDFPDNPSARSQMDELLNNLLAQNRLTLRQYLLLSSHPKSQLILKVIEKTNPLLANQAISQEEMGQLALQLQQKAMAGDADAMALLEQSK